MASIRAYPVFNWCPTMNSTSACGAEKRCEDALVFQPVCCAEITSERIWESEIGCSRADAEEAEIVDSLLAAEALRFIDSAGVWRICDQPTIGEEAVANLCERKEKWSRGRRHSDLYRALAAILLRGWVMRRLEHMHVPRGHVDRRDKQSRVSVF